MTRLIAAILSLTLGLAAAFGLVSCGSSDKGLLPGDTADEIESNLDKVLTQASDGDCEGAQASAAVISQQVDELGNGVDRQLRRALAEGAAQVESVVAACTPTETTTEITTDTELSDTATTESTAETTEADTEPTETTETTTSTPTEPTTEPTTTTEPTAPTTPAPPPPGGGEGGGSGGVGPGGKAGLD